MIVFWVYKTGWIVVLFIGIRNMEGRRAWDQKKTD